MKLENKVVLITGGNSGIGLATAQLFLKEGAKVVITARRAEAVEEYNAQNIANSFAVLADAKDIEANKAVLKSIADRFGKLDVIFLNAGIGQFIPVADWTSEAFDNVIATNLKGPLFTVQAALPFLNDGASIVFNASNANKMGMAGNAVYGATKAGIRLYSRVLANELAPRKIRVNTLSPGPIETPIWEKLDMPQEALEAMGGQIQSQVPLQRFGTAEEMAKCALFLASGDSSYVNGAELVADGGLTQV